MASNSSTMATPSEKEVPDLAKLAKQTHTGQILHIPDFYNVVEDKVLGNQIIQGLTDSGILRFCTYPYSGIYDEDIAEFYLNVSVEEQSIRSRVNNIVVEFTANDLKEIFDLPETDLEVENHVFDHQEFWNIIRGENTADTPKFSGLKSTLKWEFEKFVDILYKCLDSKIFGFDELRPPKIGLMHGVWKGIKFNWAGYIYRNIVEFCKAVKPDNQDESTVINKFLKHVGYGFVLSEILKKKGVTMRKPKTVASFKYLFRNSKTMKKRKTAETSTSRETVGSNAPRRKRGRPAKSRISEELGSNEASCVRVEAGNNEAVTSNFNETALVDVAPVHESLPIENVFTGVIEAPLQIEGLECAIDTNIMEEGSEHFVDEDPVLSAEFARVKEWRKWRLEEYQPHIAKAGPAIEKEEIFALDWLGTKDIATAIQLSTIEMVYSNKVQAKLAKTQGKLPVMEESFHALSAEDLEEIDQANLEEGLQRSLMDFHNFPGEASTIPHDQNGTTQGEETENEKEREIVSSNVPVEEPVEVHVEEPVEVPVKEAVEEHVDEQVEAPVTAQLAEPVTPMIQINEEIISVENNADITPPSVEIETTERENSPTLPVAVQSKGKEIEEQAALIDTQVIDEEHLKDFESDEDVSKMKSAKKRRIIMSEPSGSEEDEDETNEGEGMEIVPVQQKERELNMQLMRLKQTSTREESENDDLLKSLFLKVDECQETISSRFARVIELKGDIDRDAQENIFKQLRSMNDYQKDIARLLQNNTEKNERIWEKNFSEVMQVLKSNKQKADSQSKEFLNIILQQQTQIASLQNEVSLMRKEQATSSIKVDKMDAKLDRVDGNVATLVDYAKKGEESSHLALGGSPFVVPTASTGRGRGRGKFSGFSQFAGTTGPKFGVLDYFKGEQPKYTLNDAPPVIKKQPKKDQLEWVATQNRRLEDELKKGPEVPRRRMYYLSDEVAMLEELRAFTGHEGKHLDAGRSFLECIKWFREEVLPGETIQEAYSHYVSGQVKNKFKNPKCGEDFKKLRDYINKVLEKKK